MLFPDFGWVDSDHKLYPGLKYADIWGSLGVNVVGISMDFYDTDTDVNGLFFGTWKCP